MRYSAVKSELYTTNMRLGSGPSNMISHRVIPTAIGKHTLSAQLNAAVRLPRGFSFMSSHNWGTITRARSQKKIEGPASD